MFPAKQKTSSFESKNTLFGYIWNAILKNYCHIWNRHSRFVKTQSFVCAKIKSLKFGPKKLYLGIFRLKFEKPSVACDISTLELVKMQIFQQNKKTLKFWTTNVFFGLKFWDTFGIFQISTRCDFQKLLSYLKLALELYKMQNFVQ